MAADMLREAGWFPGRRVDIASKVSELESVGISVNAPAAKFMAEYADLHLVHAPSAVINGRQVTSFTDIKHSDFAYEAMMPFVMYCAKPWEWVSVLSRETASM
ncbi:SUKH-3 domain-containing protein [Streptomyces sp. NPDC054855]